MLPWLPTPRAFALISGVLAIGFGVLALSVGGQAGNGLIRAELRIAAKARMASAKVAEPQIQFEQPPRPRHLDVATPAQEARAARSLSISPSTPQGAAPPTPDPTSMPPATAGTNGSYSPPPLSQREETAPHLMAELKSQQAEGRAILINGIALAPPNAPAPVKAAISAANEIVNRPYVWGGGHASWYSTGYDCSGAVSYALGGGGLLSAPLDSTRLEGWGEPGPGRWLTVYANAGHAYAEIAGLRWDTVGDAQGSGPRWHLDPTYPDGFTQRHPVGL